MKKNNYYLSITIFVFLLSVLSVSAITKNEVKQLVCEYKTNPIGIDVQKPRLSWKIASDKENLMQTAYEIKVTDQTAKGKLVWTSGKVNSAQSVNVTYEGPALKSMQHLNWQVRVWDNENKATAWSEPASWEMGILDADLWKASWITPASEQDLKDSRPSPYLRKDFQSEKKIASARVYVTALGLYELFLNGQKVSTDLFTPGWTSYKNRIQYQTYDVTSMLKAKNTIGAILGDGWYRGNIAWGGNNYYGKKQALLCQLQINYADGTSETILSDNSWKMATGAILNSDIYNGETYDARKEIVGWSKPGFDDSKWEKVSVLDHSKKILIAPQGEVVKAIQEIKPVKILTTPKGETVFDMGQNMIGWVKLKVNGKKGDQVTLKFAEVLDKEGNFYTDNLRKAKSTDVYILKGEGEEVFEPHFTFHGFRFLKLEGLSAQPSLDQVTGVVIHSDMAPTGSFTCSDPMINQLQHNIQWGQKGNFLDVPTDCPQRDERLGWTGDAQVFSMTAAFNFNVASFYTKWMRDVAADQYSNGFVPHVIPDVLTKGEGGSTAWADASVIVPWTTYLSYGDKRILEVQYPSMKAWVEYMKSRAGDDNLWTGDSHFGDWLAFATTNSDYPGATTEKDLIATAYYSYSSGILAEIAAIIGNNDDAKKYAQLCADTKKAFQKEFVTPSGRLVSHTQTAYSLALAFDLLPEDLIPKAAKYLADDVKKMGHLTTGFVGTPLLCKTLSAQGYADLAFMLLNRKDYPSWLYPVTQGATTIWERWDGQKPDGSFQDVGMNSFNHYAYGAIGEWLYQYVAGINIDPEHPGYKHILLAPHTGGGLTNANAEFESLYGKIKSAWKLDGNDFVYEVAIPANTTATVTLPGTKEELVTVNSLPLTTEIKRGIQHSANEIKMELGSGNYVFRLPAVGVKP
jgi:alpha-L-rhamnosidase